MFGLITEYVDLGNLHQGDLALTKGECLRALHQCSSALAYLHRDKRITHRDIKPTNIVIRSRDETGKDPDGLFVKLCDFGLSKQGALSGFACTPMYAPPEIIAYSDEHFTNRGLRELGFIGYSSSVDIWSLGVTMLELSFGLPEESKEWVGNEHWCWELAHKLRWHPVSDDSTENRLATALRNMVVSRPWRRWSAKRCFDESGPEIAKAPDTKAQDTKAQEAGQVGSSPLPPACLSPFTVIY